MVVGTFLEDEQKWALIDAKTKEVYRTYDELADCDKIYRRILFKGMTLEEAESQE